MLEERDGNSLLSEYLEDVELAERMNGAKDVRNLSGPLGTIMAVGVGGTIPMTNLVCKL